MIWFCYFLKKLFFVLGLALWGPIFAKVGQKNGNFQGFQQKFFRSTGFQFKLLISIESLNIFHWKPTGFQFKLLISIESLNIFRWKATKEIKVGLVLGQHLGQIRSNVVKKVKQVLSMFFSYFTWGIPFISKSSGCTNT